MDENLIEQALNGSDSAYSEIYKRLVPLSKALVYRRFNSSFYNVIPEDIVHDAVTQVLLNLHRFDRKSKFITWAYAVMKNYVGVKARKKFYSHISVDYINEEFGDHIEWLSKESTIVKDLQNSQFVESCLSELSTKKQVMVRLKLNGYTDKEIASIFGVRLSTAKSAIYHSILKIREKVKS